MYAACILRGTLYFFIKLYLSKNRFKNKLKDEEMSKCQLYFILKTFLMRKVW